MHRGVGELTAVWLINEVEIDGTVALLPPCLEVAQAEVDTVQTVISVWPVTALISTLTVA